MIEGKIPANLLEQIPIARNDITFFCREFLGMELFSNQETWLRHSNKLINVLVPANRWGKTVITAAKHIHKAFFKIGIGGGEAVLVGDYKTLNVAPHSDIARVMFEYIPQLVKGEFAYRDPKTGKRMPNKSKIPWFYSDSKETPYMEVRFDNGARFMSRSTAEDKGTSIQGKTFAYISYDECCRSHWLDYEINANLLPRLTDFGGELDLTSTPDRESPSLVDYHTLYMKGKEGVEDYYVQEGVVDENPFLDPREVERRRKKTDPELREQIFEGKFVFAASSIFDPDEVNALFDVDMEFEEAQFKHNYLIGIDLASGEDYTVICVLDATATPHRIVRWVRFQGKSRPPQAQFQMIRDIHEHYSKGNSVDAILDASSMGGQFASAFLSDVITKNVPFTQESKKALISNLKDTLGDALVRSPEIKELRKELLLYRQDDKKLQTDSVMSLALACYGLIDYRMPAPYESRTM